ncbi:hypothetical protein HanXRQr2_Chr04g0170441 [Helianthus annuus]|uniref:Uncharacterized protein n=1 Tax=Helianthus annuus TaxID=4232 RepID=A0A9K3NT73_HELAN|nr:hypothetical protein HanXRQr2_Chr04g0170441 [Helianthus annuus]KAJ0931629.1 hypothetical protein HanPSC8_Chr04g0164011 [Helianthus annuus]
MKKLLTNSKMCVDTSVPSRARKILVFPDEKLSCKGSKYTDIEKVATLPIRYVSMSLKIPILFCEAKINDVHLP